MMGKEVTETIVKVIKLQTQTYLKEQEKINEKHMKIVLEKWENMVEAKTIEIIERELEKKKNDQTN